jgi:hypothetical protein
MVGGDDASLAVPPDRVTIDERKNPRTDAELQDEAAVDALDRGIPEATGAPDDRRDIGERGDPRRQSRRDERHLATTPQMRLGPRHRIDHALVGLARLSAKAEDPMLEQNQAFNLPILLVDFRGFAGKRKTRHDVRHDPEAIVIDLPADLLAIGLIG